MPRVMFLCTSNSVRSQMAHAILDQMHPGTFEVHSAGLHPGELHPMTVQVLHENGLKTGYLIPKALNGFLGERFHFLITVCDRAEQNCPIFPGVSERLSWPFEDPAAFEGTEAARLEKFREVYRQIEQKIHHWVALKSLQHQPSHGHRARF